MAILESSLIFVPLHALAGWQSRISSWFLLDGFAKVSFIPGLTLLSLGACLGFEEPLPFLGGRLGDATVMTILGWKGIGSPRAGVSHVLPLT